MPLTLQQLNQRLELSLEKITDFREEVESILDENPSLKTVSFNPVQFFQQLTSVQDQFLAQFDDNAEGLSKMFDLASKAAKEEMKRRINQKKIDKLHKKMALKFKLKSKNQTSKTKKRNRKIKSLLLNESQESSQEISDH